MKILEIPFQIPGLNEYINAERTNRYIAANLKKKWQDEVTACIKEQGIGELSVPVYMVYRWTEKTRRRDKDNISSFGRKVIQDALVQSGAIENDGWEQIDGFRDEFDVDKSNPMVKVFIYEKHDAYSTKITRK